MIGTTISHYKIVEKLGQGGMGHVYLAEDLQLGRKAAIKMLAPEFSKDEIVRQRFKREAQAVAALNHQNIVTIFEFGDYNNTPYIVMEYVDGESLRERLLRKRLTLPDIIHIALQICEGLAKSHNTGIIHRDLKPENILFDRDDRVKILDFGLAKFRNHENITHKSMRVGTINYMSPEQLSGQEVDAQSDIFSFGIILYELFTGSLPFKGEYEASIIYAILHENPKPLLEINKELPAQVQKVIDRALAKEKNDRYTSVGQLAGELSTLLSVPVPSADLPLKSGISANSVEELLEHRQNIDKLIETKYKRSIVILFSDIVGSTRFFEQRGDIDGRAMLSRHNRQMFPIIKKHSGTVIKTMGDSIMASFGEVQDGCACARQMQQSLLEENKTLPPEDRISIRIALHFGKAVIEKDDVFGDAVNVASRVEKFTDGDQIMISQAVVDALTDGHDFVFEQVGSVDMKGKSEKMSLYRLKWYDEELIEQIPEVDSEVSEHISTPAPQTANTVTILKPFKLEIPQKLKSDALSDEIKNPYMNRVMIQDIEEFFGRRSEVEKIYSRVGSSRPQSISLVGTRRIGKSSLLNFVQHPANRRKYLKNADEFIFIFIDFQERRGIQIADFFSSIYEALYDAFNGNLRIDVSPDYEGFKKIVSTFEDAGLKLILLFDEFELITKNKNFDTEFYSFCRSIANNYNVAYIVSSARNLQTLTHSKEISDSPFFNIFSNMTLSQFNRPEAVALITEPAKKMDIAQQPYIDFIIDIAGYYPFFIQMACAALFEHLKNNDLRNNALQEAVKEDFLDEAKVHFQQIWESSGEYQKEVILLLCQGKKIPPSQSYLLKNLEKEGYVKTGKKKPEIFSSLFREYILSRYAVKSKSGSFFWPFSGKTQRSTG
jgi:serine/threonine protein kinase/AAA+ ATPase superfamily predicted ATPase